MTLPAALFAITIFGIHFGGSPMLKSTEHFSIPVTQQLPLDVRTNSGDITVRGGTQPEIEVTVIKRAPSQAQLAQMHVARRIGARAIHLTTVYQHGCWWDCGDISFQITLPAKTALTLHTNSGDVRVRAMSASVGASTSSGDIHVDGAAAERSDVVNLSDESGDITLRDIGGTIAAETSSGDVSLRDASTSALTRAKLSSSSGDISLFVPQNPSIRLDARTSSGSIRTNLGIRVRGQYAAERAAAQLGTGRVTVHLSTSSGDITIDGAQ
ncbi:MAG: DUF4097 family beta strand repeat-containing protein [Candidatus Eremiobacteraeota bacterium]|nr:DUF4097 family beta strand repeat-containing protein [Candidatus Eremiobacteraeota bacterium]NNN00123.1 DUF4097 family beta strand repeat protein [Candidatus Eremiobacteraeota bacterium]